MNSCHCFLYQRQKNRKVKVAAAAVSFCLFLNAAFVVCVTAAVAVVGVQNDNGTPLSIFMLRGINV